MKRRAIQTAAFVLAAILLMICAVDPTAGSPVIDKSYSAGLEQKDSKPLSVEINEVERVETLPQSVALDLLEDAQDTKAENKKSAAASSKEIALDENADTAASQAVFQANLNTLMEGGTQAEFVRFLEKKYQNTTIISLLDFAEYLMGVNNPVKSIVDMIDWLKNGVNDFRISMEVVSDVTTLYTPGSAVSNASGQVQEFYFHFSDNNGTLYILATGVYWDAQNQLLYGKDEKGIFALGYDMDVKKLMLYTPVQAWQRNFGFTALYDFFAPALNMVYATERVKFTYGNYDWLVQIWKGRYAAGCGAELGIYYKDKASPLEFYNCATDEMMLPMSMQLFFGSQKLLEREEMHHWWLSGFVLVPIYIPQLLTLKGSVTFQSKGMADAFVKAAKSISAIKDIKAEEKGLKISFSW